MSIRTVLTPRARDAREWPRYLLHEAVPLTLKVAAQDFACHIEDISLGGARLIVQGPLPPQQEIILEHPYVGEVGGQRLWEAGPQEGGYQVGIGFDFADAPLTLIAHCLSQTSEAPHIVAAE